MNSGTAYVDKRFAAIPLIQKKHADSSLKKKKVIVLAGPTAVGKTRASLSIAQAIGGEVVSADSMQVYMGMDIGTAKVSKEERFKIPHHLIDARDLHETFNVVDFYQECLQSLREIFAKGHAPIVVGGTGFYIHALLYGPPSGPPSTPEVRSFLEKEMQEKGSHLLYERLRAFDPEYAKTITQSDRHKIIRALEIISITQQKVSSFQPSTDVLNYDFRCWFLYMPREILYPLIEKRCDKILEDGFIEEVRALRSEGLESNLSASQAIGYRQCLEYLKTQQTDEDFQRFVREFKKASRHYAKRQFTWFRKEPLFRWLDLAKTPFEAALEMILQDYELG